MALPAPQSRLLARLKTPGFAGYNLAWSPFYPDRLAVAAAANYGLVGNGKVFVVNCRPGAPGRDGAPGMAVERG
jgi:peroxin-7